MPLNPCLSVAWIEETVAQIEERREETFSIRRSERVQSNHLSLPSNTHVCRRVDRSGVTSKSRANRESDCRFELDRLAAEPSQTRNNRFVLEKKNSKREMVSTKGSEKAGLDTWNATASFQNITYWNHDTIPSESDTFNCCFHWFAVANAIHKPITAAEVASETCQNGTKNGATCGQKRKSNKRC